MAGGENAALVPCLNCVGRAIRTFEGMEDDWYECTECGAKFGIDWSHEGPPQKPCWPLSEEEIKEARRVIAVIKQLRAESKGT